MPRFDPSIRDRSLQGERDRGGRGIGVSLNRDDHLFLRQAEFSTHTVYDPAVRLMWDEPIDIRRGEAVCNKSLVHHRAQVLNRQPKNLTSLHPQKASSTSRGRSPVDVEDLVLASVRMQMV